MFPYCQRQHRTDNLVSLTIDSADSGTEAIPTYAQDPVFNTLDHALLASLDIDVLSHPAAFDHIGSNTLLFCPGAERKHLELVLPANPRLLFGGPLENSESAIIQDFVRQTESRVLLPFVAQEHAFWMTRLYFRIVEDTEVKAGNGVIHVNV